MYIPQYIKNSDLSHVSQIQIQEYKHTKVYLY